MGKKSRQKKMRKEGNLPAVKRRKSLLDIQITDDEDFHPFDYEMTKDIEDVINMAWKMHLENPEEAVKILPALIEKMPQVPNFPNYLTNALQALNRMEEAKKVIDQTLIDHPDYIFGVINKATIHLMDGDLEKFVQRLGGMPLRIDRTFPKRKVFHVKEIFDYYKLLLHFALEVRNLEAAVDIFELLQEMMPDNPDLEIVSRDIFNYIVENEMKFDWSKVK